jgi:hypothetical protein
MNWFFGLSPSRNPFVVGSALRTFFEELGTLGGLAVVGIGVASVISLISRLDSARGDERQQIKWFTYAAAVIVGVPLVVAPFVAAMTERMGGSWEVGLAVPPLASLLGIPVAVGIAILKYRLYDIDVVINRTLAYGALTVMLALVYFGGVAATEAIFRALTGQERQPQIAVVVSTLVIAALFSPLRRRIQGFIDRISERTKRQRRLVGIPTFLLLTGVLVLSSVRLAQIGSYSVYFSVFFGTFVVLLVFNAVDLPILDWLVFVTLRPKIVVLPGTEGAEGYGDYGFHFRRSSKVWRGRPSLAS